MEALCTTSSREADEFVIEILVADVLRLGAELWLEADDVTFGRDGAEESLVRWIVAPSWMPFPLLLGRVENAEELATFLRSLREVEVSPLAGLSSASDAIFRRQCPCRGPRLQHGRASQSLPRLHALSGLLA